MPQLKGNRTTWLWLKRVLGIGLEARRLAVVFRTGLFFSLGLCLIPSLAQAQADEFSLPFASMEAAAKIYYLSPEGAGDGDGSSTENAMPLSRLEPFITHLDHSAKVIWLPGTYVVSDTLDLRSPNPESLVVMDGNGQATMKGDFDFVSGSGGATGIRLKSGNVVIRGIRFVRTKTCVRTDNQSVVNQVLIENITASEVHSCIVADNDTSLEISRWIIRDSDIQGYFRVGVRLGGANAHDFLISDLLIDGHHNLGNDDCYKGGIQLLAGVSKVTVRHTTIQNNIGKCPSYQQGDGVEADHKKGTPHDILFDNVKVSNSGDADFDLKAEGVTLNNITALGGDLTRYAFKVWTYRNYVCRDCMAYQFNKAYINLNQAKMTFQNATFSNHKPVRVCDLRDGTTEAEKAEAVFVNSKIYADQDQWLMDCGGDAISSVHRLPQGQFAPPGPVRGVDIK